MSEGQTEFQDEVKNPSEKQALEVRIHVGNFLPWSAFARNAQLRRWVEECGADGMEWMPVGPNLPESIAKHVPVGPTQEVVAKPFSALHEVFGDTLKSGHVVFNPFATLSSIFGRREDPLRPGTPIFFLNLVLSQEPVAREALLRLEALQKGNFPIVVYPKLQGETDFSASDHYRIPLLQTVPLFDGELTPAEMVKAVEKEEYAGVCVDLAHMREADNQTGTRPFGETEDEWMKALDVLRPAIREVHVQPDYTAGLENKRLDEVGAIFDYNPSYQTPMGKLLRHLIHDLEFMGPYTSEMNPLALVRIYGKQILLPPDLSPMLEAQGAFVDYIKRA